MRKRKNFLLVLTLVLVINVGCGGSRGTESASADAPTGSRGPVSMDKNDYPVFPDVDAGADPAVPAEAGGKGFTGEGWETNTSFDLIGDPRAVKGGSVREYALGFPATLRVIGPESNTTTNETIGELVYETLLKLHPTTLDYIPVLATHWQIAPDKMTFRFRLNPNARFSDGTAVTAEDVVASWKLHADKTLNEPARYLDFNKLEQPVAESKYIVRIKAKEPLWQNFFNVATVLRIFPAHILKNLNGKSYTE